MSMVWGSYELDVLRVASNVVGRAAWILIVRVVVDIDVIMPMVVAHDGRVKIYDVGLEDKLDRLRKLLGFLMVCNDAQLVYDDSFRLLSIRN